MENITNGIILILMSNLSDDFATLISELERVADHLTNIGYSVINPTGDEE